MPNYRFLTRDQLEKLIRDLQSNVVNDGNLAGSVRWKSYLEALTKLNEAMERLSQIETDRTKPGAGLPRDLTMDDARELQTLLEQTALAGESFLAEADAVTGLMLGEGENETVDLTNRLQDLLSRDYDVLGAYDGEPPRSLPEIQEAGRSLTIDLRDRKLGAVGNISSSRLPMTVVDSSGNKRTGFFTKAYTSNTTGLFKAILRQARSLCNDAGKAEMDSFFTHIKTAVRGMERADGGKVRLTDPEELIISTFAHALHSYTNNLYEVNGNSGAELTEDQMKTFLKKCRINTKLLSGDAIAVLTEGFNKLSNDMALQIRGQRLMLEDGARLDNRNSAMSAVASLLGVPKLIARADPMKFIQKDGSVLEGTFMDFADGHDLFASPALMAGVARNPFQSEAARRSLNRQIADLQVLDFLCLNEDRHPGNLMYQVDKITGMITGIQGFDNDSSFARRMPMAGEAECLKVVSEDMAKTLERLTPNMLRFALRGHNLTDREIDMAVRRLDILKEKIKEGAIEVLSDEELGKSRPKAFATDENNVRSNLFKNLDESLSAKIAEVHHVLGIASGEYRVNDPEKPEFANVPTEDRVFTVGSVMDSLKAVSRLYENKETGFKQSKLVNSHGKSENFKKLMDAVKESSELQKQLLAAQRKSALPVDEHKIKEPDDLLPQKGAPKSREGAAKAPKAGAKAKPRESYVPGDGVSLNESSARRLQEQVDQSFDKLELLANSYLEGKRVQRRAATVEAIVPKNDYERRHIEHALNVLKTVREYRQNTAVPETEEEKQAHMARADKAALEEMRAAKEAALKIQQQNQQANQPQEPDRLLIP